MQRNTNFAKPAHIPVFPVVVVLWLGALAAAAACVWMFLQVSTLKDASARLQEHTGKLQAEVVQLGAAGDAAPSADAIQTLRQRAVFFNELTGLRRAPLAALLIELETQIPTDVWISQMNYSLDSGRLSLSLQADQETRLPPALSKIEGSGLLGDVILERQLRLQQGQRSLVQYDVQALVQ